MRTNWQAEELGDEFLELPLQELKMVRDGLATALGDSPVDQNVAVELALEGEGYVKIQFQRRRATELIEVIENALLDPGARESEYIEIVAYPVGATGVEEVLCLRGVADTPR